MTRVPTGYLSATFSHGLGALLLEPQGDLLAILVDVQDHDLDLVVDLEHVAGVIDPAPAHVGDVQQAVDAAQVHERAEVGDVLDRALADLADLDLLEKLLLLLLAGDLDELAAADHDVPPALIDLEDHAFDVLIDVVGDVGRTADVDLAGRQEDVDADIDEQSALDLAGDLALDDVALVVLGDHHLPGAHPVGLLPGQDDLAGIVFHPLEQDLDGFARLRRRARPPTRRAGPAPRTCNRHRRRPGLPTTSTILPETMAPISKLCPSPRK